MAVTIATNPNEGITLAPHHYFGLASDTKPTVASPGSLPTPRTGSTFLEHDTGALYITYDGTNWVLDSGDYNPDDLASYFGTGGTIKILYETADANANLLKVIFPEGGATDVPGILFGDASIDNTDDGWFNGLTEPFIAVANDAADAYASLDAGDDAVAGSKGLYFKAAADEDIELENLSVTGTPRRYWDESEDKYHTTKGWYFDAASTFDGGALDNEFLTTGVGVGIQITNTNTGDTGARLTLYSNSANPAIEDDCGEVRFSGEDSASAKIGYGLMRCRLKNVTSGSTGANYLWYLRDAGADNLAMELAQTGALWTDLSVDTLTYKVSGTQVVGARIVDSRCDDTINSGDATTDGVIDALRDAMITHGLIAAA